MFSFKYSMTSYLVLSFKEKRKKKNNKNIETSC